MSAQAAATQSRLRDHLTYANVVSSMCLFLLLAGTTAYAANTVFSTDIVDGQVKTPDLENGAVSLAKIADGSITGDKLKDGSIQGRDVLDNNLKGADIDESTLTNIGGGGPAGGDLTGTYPDPTIGPNSVGALELERTTFLENGSFELSDNPGGNAAEVRLILENSPYDVVGRCTDNGGGIATAEVFAKGSQTPATRVAMSSAGAQGVTDIVGLDPGEPAKMIGVGPTDDSHWRAGAYSLTAAATPGNELIQPLHGVIAAGTHVHDRECLFSITATG